MVMISAAWLDIVKGPSSQATPRELLMEEIVVITLAEWSEKLCLQPPSFQVYATGAVTGGDGDDDVGGLVGDGRGSSANIIASYATGTVDGGEEDTDSVGSLVGRNSPTVTASYGFGSTSNGTNSNIGTTLPDSCDGGFRA